MREKIAQVSGRVSEFSLYIAAFYIPISNALIETFSCLAIAAWLVKKISLRVSPRRLFYPNVLALPVFAYFLACLVSSFFSSNRAISFNHLILKTTEYLLLFFIVVELSDRRFVRNILTVLVISVGLVGIDGIFQYFTNFDFLRGRSPVVPGRINGPFYFPNDFANYIVSLLPLVAGLSFVKFKSLRIWGGLVFIAIILLACIILSASRSAWIALLFLLPAAALLGNKKLFFFFVALFMLISVFFPFMSDLHKSRIENFFDYKETALVGDRRYLLHTAFNMFRDKPILGQGLGTFMYNFNKFKYSPPGGYPGSEGISYAHNCFLQMAAETGLIGLSSFLLIPYVLFVNFFILFTVLKNRGYFFLLSGLLLGLFAYLISSFFDTNLYSLSLAVLFWLMLGLAAGAIKIIKEERQAAS